MDAATVYRAGEAGAGQLWLHPIPAEHLQYRSGERVVVWAQSSSTGAPGLSHGTVRRFEYHGRFEVTLDALRPRSTARRVLHYASGALAADTFSHAFAAGHCGNLQRRRIFVRLYAVSPAPGAQGDRARWRGLLVGPSARPLGRLLGTKLGIMPDLDSSTAGAGDGECYWLNLRAQSAEAVCTQVQATTAALLAPSSYPALLKLLESGQSLALSFAAASGAAILQGSCAHALAPGLRRALPSASISLGETSCSRVARERLVIEGLLDSDASLLQAAVLEEMRAAGLPEAMLALGAQQPGGGAAAFPRRHGDWRVSTEGPDARYPGAPPPGNAHFAGAYVCPANTLAVQGPQAEVACFVNYVVENASAPVCVHATEQPPSSRHLGSFPNPAQAAAAQAAAAYKREQAGGNYYGHWDITAPEAEEERLLMEAVLHAWNERNLKNVLEGRLCCVPPSTPSARVLLQRAPAVVEYGDFEDGDSSHRVFCDLGPVGAGVGQLWNPAFPVPGRTTGWLRSAGGGAGPEYVVRLLVASLPGVAFPLAKAREAAEAKLSPTKLSALETSREDLARLQSALRAQRVHVEPVPLPDFQGNPAEAGVTPLPFCPSLHPQLLNMASDFQVRDLEDWAKSVSDATLPCSLCGDCARLLNGAMPGLLTLRPSPGILVATFPCAWRPASAAPSARSARAQHWQARALADARAPLALLGAPGDAEDAEEAARRSSRATTGATEEAGAAAAAAAELARVALFAEELQGGRSGRAPRHWPARWPMSLKQVLVELRHFFGWDSLVLLRLFGLAGIDEPSHQDGLAALLGALHGGGEEVLAAAAAWAGGGGANVNRILRLRITLLNKGRQGRPLLKSARATFVKTLASAANVRLSASLLLATRASLVDGENWDSCAIGKWARHTLEWQWPFAESVELLHSASEALLLPRDVLALASRFSNCEFFRTALAMQQQGRAAHDAAAPTVLPQMRLSALQRTREQITAPQPSEPRWQDAQEQPEHQALLLAHALREMIALWMALAVDDRGALQTTITPGDVGGRAARRRRVPLE